MVERNILMRKILIILFLFYSTYSFSQLNDLKSFFHKYFAELNFTEHYSLWPKQLNKHPNLLIQHPDSVKTDSTYVTYKLKSHPLIENDSTKVYLQFRHTVKTDTILKKIVDSLFSITLYIVYGQGKSKRQQMRKHYKFILREPIGETAKYHFTEYYNYGKSYYAGYTYEFGKPIMIPQPLSIAWTITQNKNYVLRINYLIYTKVFE
jgi:hypothetical protein